MAVIGPNADNAPMMWGNYNGMPNHTITILDGIKAKQKKLFYDKGCDLTYDKVMDCLMASQCSFEGKKGDIYRVYVPENIGTYASRAKIIIKKKEGKKK